MRKKPDAKDPWRKYLKAASPLRKLSRLPPARMYKGMLRISIPRNSTNKIGITDQQYRTDQGEDDQGVLFGHVLPHPAVVIHAEEEQQHGDQS
jgi:hypothetical protein